MTIYLIQLLIAISVIDIFAHISHLLDIIAYGCHGFSLRSVFLQFERGSVTVPTVVVVVEINLWNSTEDSLLTVDMLAFYSRLIEVLSISRPILVPLRS